VCCSIRMVSYGLSTRILLQNGGKLKKVEEAGNEQTLADHSFYFMCI
jgi:hypothetical protein